MIGLFLVLAFGQAAETDRTEEEVRQAIERSLPYLAREGESWMEERGCVSCHHVPLMIWSHNEAQARVRGG